MPEFNNGEIGSFFHVHPHIAAVSQFTSWLRETNPHLYEGIKAVRPKLLDASSVVVSGMLTEKPKSRTAKKGMGAYDDADFSTSWAQEIVSTVNAIMPTYFNVKSQKDLLDANLHQAELGLPPITNTGYVPPATTSKPLLLLGGLLVLMLASKGR